MKRVCWWLVDVACRMLDRSEREAVRGDLAESGESGGQALLGVFGLVARRQAALLSDWRCWLALAVFVVPLGMLLSFFATRTADWSAVYIWLYANNWTWSYVTNAGNRLCLLNQSASIFDQYLLLSCGAWMGGFMLGRLSRRFIWINAFAFCLVLVIPQLSVTHVHGPLHKAVFSLTFYNVFFPLLLLMVLVLIPSIWGLRAASSAT